MKFIPEQKVLNDFFGDGITYVIPEYQRPYSWDCIGKSDKNNQVNVVWQDLIEFFESKDSGIYFMGSMVVIGDETVKREFEVVDGQQRLTTLTILFVAIKCLLAEVGAKKQLEEGRVEELQNFIRDAEAVIDSLVFNKKIFGAILQEKKVKIARLGGFDYDDVLKTVMECGDISQLNLREATEEQKTVSARFFNNREFLIDQLREKFLFAGILTYELALQLNEFIEFLKYKVTLIRIQSPTFEDSYHIFEILNNRGLPLSNKDLFRNFLIKEFSALKARSPERYATLDPNQKWRVLEDDHDFRPDFINRYVESKLGKNQEFTAFNELKKSIFNRGFEDTLAKSRVELFYEDIEHSLEIYTEIVHLQFPDKQLRNRIQFLMNSGNATYVLNLLMALFRNVSDKGQQLAFVRALERYVLFVRLEPNNRFRASLIYATVKDLNTGRYDDALAALAQEIAQGFDLKRRLNDPKDIETAKLLMVRYYWALENQTPQDIIEQSLDFGIATLEHIIPQNPSPDSNWTQDFSIGFRKQYLNCLGNLTLLTQSMNSKAKNFDFKDKRKVYAQTKLAMTRDLAADKVLMNEAFIVARQAMIVAVLVNDLGG